MCDKHPNNLNILLLCIVLLYFVCLFSLTLITQTPTAIFCSFYEILQTVQAVSKIARFNTTRIPVVERYKQLPLLYLVESREKNWVF